jgi:hypothetical protein
MTCTTRVGLDPLGVASKAFAEAPRASGVSGCRIPDYSVLFTDQDLGGDGRNVSCEIFEG